jgi:hypothetical protein
MAGKETGTVSGLLFLLTYKATTRYRYRILLAVNPPKRVSENKEKAKHRAYAMAIHVRSVIPAGSKG